MTQPKVDRAIGVTQSNCDPHYKIGTIDSLAGTIGNHGKWPAALFEATEYEMRGR